MIVKKLSITADGRSLIERDVKKRVKEIIELADPANHIFMPVQNGYGAADLDFNITIHGHALRVEAKVGRKLPSPRQELTIAALVKSGACVLIIDEHNLVDLALCAVFLREDAKYAAKLIANDSREIYYEER